MRIYKIECYWSTDLFKAENGSNNYEGLYRGWIIKKGNCWVEGYMTLVGTSYNDIRYIFGVLSKSKGINLTSIVPSPAEIVHPVKFVANKNGKSYEGNFDMPDFCGVENPLIGHCVININKDKKKGINLNKLENLKSSMGLTDKEIYTTTYFTRKNTLKNVNDSMIKPGYCYSKSLFQHNQY